METTDYVSYPIALALKKAGFDWKCHYHYDSDRGSHIIEPNYTTNDGEGCQYITADDLLEDNNGWQYCSAPTLWQAQKWLREKKGIAINVIAHDYREEYVESKFHWNEVLLTDVDRSGEQWRKYFIFGMHPLFDTYEEALSDGLSQMLELITKGE